MRTLVRSHPITGKKDTERYVFLHALRCDPSIFVKDFPAGILHGDKPDSMVKSGNHVTLWEVTRAEAQQTAHARSVGRELSIPFDSGHFRASSPMRRQAEIKAIMENCDFSSPPWIGSESDDEVVDLISERLLEKAQKANGYTRGRHDALGLLIYENGAGPSGNLQAIAERIRRAPDLTEAMSVFSKVMLLDGSGSALVRVK